MKINQIHGWLILLVFTIAILLIPLQVFGIAEDEKDGAESSETFLTIPVSYEMERADTDGTTGDIVYDLKGAADESADMHMFRFHLPKGSDVVTMSASNLKLRKKNDVTRTETLRCDFRMTITRTESEDDADAVVTISKDPLPVLRISGKAGVSLRYGWYKAGGDYQDTVLPTVSETFNRISLEPESLPESTEKEKSEDEYSSPVPLKTEDEQPENSEKEKEEKEQLNGHQADVTQPLIEDTEAPVAEKETANSDAGTKPEKKKSEKVRRSVVTEIREPMNHVRISEKVTSGETKIDKDSIRVTHNGTDVTDNCLINMTDDGFVVDPQMNTNEGDRFVTTYTATPEGEGEIRSQTSAYTEDEDEEDEEEADVTGEPEASEPEEPSVVTAETQLTKGAIAAIALVILTALFLLIKHRRKLGGILCKQKIKELLSGRLPFSYRLF
jgi:hypothetical protein